ncbi:hypothetical protein ABZ942_30850 [Nocardia sp. NPDC046473]
MGITMFREESSEEVGRSVTGREVAVFASAAPLGIEYGFPG